MPLLSGNITALPYIITGLLIILLFWSRSLIHTFTVISWPLEFDHNFGYIACTLVEAIMFTQLSNVRYRYLLGFVYAVMIWFLFAFDLRMIRRRLFESTGIKSKQLFEILMREQLLHTRIGLPMVTLFFAISTIFAWTSPDWFVSSNGHVIFAALQLLTAAIYLAYVFYFFRRIAPLILLHREENQI
jgi:hypothetical protein